MLSARHRIEVVVLFSLGVAAVVLEIVQVDDVGGRDPFRVLLPSFCIVLGLLLFDLLALVAKLQQHVERVEKMLRRQSAEHQIEETYQRLGGFGHGPETKGAM